MINVRQYKSVCGENSQEKRGKTGSSIWKCVRGQERDSPVEERVLKIKERWDWPAAVAATILENVSTPANFHTVFPPVSGDT